MKKLITFNSIDPTFVFDYETKHTVESIKGLFLENHVYYVDSRENGLYLVLLEEENPVLPLDSIGISVCSKDEVSNPEKEILYMDYDSCERSVYYDVLTKDKESDIYEYLEIFLVEYSYVFGLAFLFFVAIVVLLNS